MFPDRNLSLWKSAYISDIVYDMGVEIIDTKVIGSNTYRILLLGSKYTVYLKEKPEKDGEEESFSALASFDSLKEARSHIDSLEEKRSAS